VRCDMESLFLLAFGEEDFLASVAMAGRILIFLLVVCSRQLSLKIPHC